MKRSTLVTIIVVAALVVAALALRASGGGLMDTLASLHGRPARH